MMLRSLTLALLVSTPALAQNGFLPTPGAIPGQYETDGFLPTPGAQTGGLDMTAQGLARGRTTGLIATPGVAVPPTQRVLVDPTQADGLVVPTYQGRVADAVAEPAPIGTQHVDSTVPPTAGPGPEPTVIAPSPGWDANLGPFSQPVWQNTPPQTLWSDTRPRDEHGNPVPVDTYSSSLRETDLPNPNPANPDAYQPEHLYDRFRPSRPGGHVFYTPDPRADGGLTNVQGRLVDDEYDQRQGTANRAPAFVSALAEKYGDLEPWIWGRAVVVDGDTLLMNGERLRLAGIDAPELDQTCQQGSLVIACGTNSQKFLAAHVEHQPLGCLIHFRDTVGRLVATCYAEDFEVNGTLIARGQAVVWKHAPSPYDGMAADARDGSVGIWETVFEHPFDWRSNAQHTRETTAFANQYDRQQGVPFPYVPFGTNPEGRIHPTFQNPVAPSYMSDSRP